MAVFKKAVGSSNEIFKQIPDCQLTSNDPVGNPKPCENKALWRAVDQQTKKEIFCCSKHLIQVLSSGQIFLVHSIV